MDITHLREKILTDTTFVLRETEKIQYLYGLKHEIRYDETRAAITESVAEHIYGMHIIADYFMVLEDIESSWKKDRIYAMITWHDIDEVETGDMIGYKKTQEDRDRELSATDLVIEKSPDTLQTVMRDLLTEYQKQETIESRFVKALDKIEPLFQLYNDNGKRILHRNKTTQADSRKIKDVYVAAFPIIRQFNDVLNNVMESEGFYHPHA